MTPVRIALLCLVLASGMVPVASAGPALQFSRTNVDFSDVARNFPSPVQPVYVTNIGDAALEIGALTLGGAHPEDFVVSGTCTVPVSLAPGQHCRIDLVFFSPTDTLILDATLSIASNAGPSPAVVTLRGKSEGNLIGVPFIVPAPDYLEFGEQPAGTSSTLDIRLTNLIPSQPNPPGSSPLVFDFSINAVTLAGVDSADFSVTSPCLTTKILYKDQTCVFTVTFTPGQAGLRTAELVVDVASIGVAPALNLIVPYSVAGVGSMASTATVVEYYNGSLDHYFVTWLPAEIATLDAGVSIRGWTRTGQTFRTLASPGGGTTAVCRYYIPPARGDSHFFGRGSVECADTGTRNPTFVLEDSAFMHMYLPASGTCPAGTTRIYRVFSNRPDANHRYMTDPAIRSQMVARGWLAEGDGPDLVVMCAPSA